MIGLIWTPCAGPILAAVLVLVIRQETDLSSLGIVVSFAAGAGLPMLIIALTGRKIIRRLSFFTSHAEAVRRELLRTIEHYSRDVWCSISLLENNGTTLRHGAAPSLPQAFNNMLNGITVDANAQAPCALAVYHRRSVVIKDMLNDALPTEFHKLALNYNLQACWAQPILSETGKAIGAFTTYYKQAHHPSDIEKALINQTVPLMGTAITHLGLEATA